MWSSADWPLLAIELRNTKRIVFWRQRLPRLLRKQIPACWGQPNASYWPLRTDVDSQASAYSSDELFIAATLCAAGLQASREIQLPELEIRVFDLVIPDNELVTGWRKGRRLGLIKFLAGDRKIF